MSAHSSEAKRVAIQRRYLDSGINWDWFTEVEFYPETMSCRVLAHYRIHRYDDPTCPTYVKLQPSNRPQLLEDHAKPGRIVYGFQVNKEEWLVENPQNIFTYHFGEVMPLDVAERVVNG